MQSESAGQTDTSEGPSFFAESLAALKCVAPALAHRLVRIKTPQTRIVRDDRGRIDLALLDHGLYEADARAHALAQVEQFLAAPQRNVMSRPDPARLVGSVGDFCERVTERLAAAGFVTAAGALTDDTRFLFSFGVGLGFHLETLIARTSAQVIILIEPNLEFLWHSLHVVDWRHLLRLDTPGERKFLFIVERNPARIAEQAAVLMRAHNPALLDGAYFFAHYHSSVLAAARDRLRRDLHLTIAGLGYFEDERIMTRNAVAQLGGAAARILGRGLPERSEPMLLVGAGPSLDRDLEFIRAQRPNALLMSLGTGLRALLNAGIRPDFHIELENSQISANAVAASTAGFDTAGITLIASLTVPSSVPKLFPRAWFFFRERMSSTQVFGRGFDLVTPSGPTVANAGLGVAIKLGFRELYLFGVDMGSKVAGRYHAGGTIYDSGSFQDTSVPQESLPGNFGGSAATIATAQGQPVLGWSRHLLEAKLAQNSEVRVYNCSDGVRIAGAVPRLSRVVEFTRGAIDRARIMADLESAMLVLPASEARRRWEAAQTDASAGFARAYALIDNELAKPMPGTDWLMELFERFCPKPDGDRVMRSFLAGTMMMLMGAATWYDRHLVDPTQRSRARRMAYEELRAELVRLEQDYAALIAEVERALAPAERTAAA